MTSRPLFARVAESIVIFAPIVQVGWRSACSRRDRGERPRARIEERAAGRGQDQRARRRRIARRRGTARSPSAPSRSAGARRAGWRTGRAASVAATRRGQRAGQRHDEVAAGDEGLLVRRRDDLAGAQRGEDRPQADDAAGGDDDEVDVVARRELLERIRSGRRRSRRQVEPSGRRVAEGDDAGRSAACSSSSSRSCPAASATTRNASGMGRQDVDRLAPDRAGRAEEGDADGGRVVRLSARTATT